MKSLQNALMPSSLGIRFGIPMLPFTNLTIAIPAVIATKTMANPTDNADVYFSESASTKQEKLKGFKCIICANQVHVLAKKKEVLQSNSKHVLREEVRHDLKMPSC